MPERKTQLSDKAIELLLEGVASLADLEATIQAWLDSGQISSDKAAEVYEKYAISIDPFGYYGFTPEQINYLEQSTTKEDLADRMVGMGLDRDISTNIIQFMSKQPTATSRWAFGAAQERLATAQVTAQQLRQTRATELTQAMDYIQNNPLVNRQDLSFLRQNLENIKATTGRDITEEYLTGQSDVLMNLYENINQQARARATAEEQAGRAMLAGMTRPLTKNIWQRGPVPTGEDIVEPFLEGTYAPGTKLRSFIASEIPTVMDKIRAEREAWWKGMIPEPEYGGESFEEAQGRTQSEAERWEAIAAGAPASEYTAETYWGPGGLAGIAQTAAERARGTLAGLKPGDYPAAWTPDPGMPQPVEEDPLRKKLRERNWLAEFYRRPGSGIVPRLQPAARF